MPDISGDVQRLEAERLRPAPAEIANAEARIRRDITAIVEILAHAMLGPRRCPHCGNRR